MATRPSLQLIVFIVVGAVLLMPLHARQLSAASTSPGEPAGPAHKTAAGKATKGTSTTQREAGWVSSFMPSFMPSFGMPSSFGALPFNKKTTDPRSSLTGIPQLMTFEQQLSGGLPVDSYTAPAQPAPAPVQPTAASQPVSTPAPRQEPAPPSTEALACSPDDRSADAVHRCVNAMRTDPYRWTSAYKCNYNQWIGSYGARRPALRQNNRLASASAKLAQDMAATRTVSHVGADGSSMAQRIQEQGFGSYPQAENVAGGQGSALEVAADWMCSQGHRDNIMSCSMDSVGTSTAYDVNGRAYYVQDFGCSTSNRCSC